MLINCLICYSNSVITANGVYEDKNSANQIQWNCDSAFDLGSVEIVLGTNFDSTSKE